MKVIFVARKALAAYLMQLGSAPADVEDRCGVEVERPVDFGQHGPRALIFRADHDAVGMLEILDGGALAQEFRVGHDLDGRVRTPLAQDAFDLVAGTHGDRRFRHHHGRAGEHRRDLVHRVVDEAQIGMTVAAARRRTHPDEHGFGIGRALRFRGEFEPAFAEVRFDEVGKAGLEDRNLAAVERGDAAGIPVDHRHLMTEIGKAGAGDEPDVASPDHGHAHERSARAQD